MNKRAKILRAIKEVGDKHDTGRPSRVNTK